MNKKRWYSPQELADAKLLINHPSVWSVRRLIQNGKLEAKNFSCATQARLKISQDEVERYNAKFN